MLRYVTCEFCIRFFLSFAVFAIVNAGDVEGAMKRRGSF